MPHDLTGAQKRTIREIVQDMRSPRPMNRLLQGDVGSGKTFVAMAAMILAVESNCQAALMAPTQILAEQHYSTFRHWLEPLGIKISLHTGNCDLRNYEESEGPSQIIIGTHALIHDQSLFQDLGLVVIDEQHRFGVAQRTKLIHRGVFPDVLVMTATPIPRTLTMTAYGDLELSMIDEKPPGRGHVRTVVRVLPKQTAINKFVAEKISAGGQVYLVYPLVEEGSSAKIESATGAITKWRKRLAGNSVSLLHGKMKAEEKEQIMNDFRTGVTSALVCTSVIEVGVDVANANLIIIHHADRFGLAQLHQLRGRVGRGGKKGYCILLTDGKSAEGLEKLRVLENNSDGFKIAEEDLKIRGPGEVLGKAQSGTAVFRFPEYLADQAMMAEARKRAEAILTEDPTLDGLHANMKCHIKTIPSMEPSAHSGPLEN